MGEKKITASADRKALYRKYRSKSLGEIIGQVHVTKTLENALKNGKINHAYLFTGPRGTGKTSIARIIAHTINDLPYEEEVNHLDIIEIDAASNRRIDDIRDLRDKVHIAPVSAKYKVYIIDEVHMLTTESFNALLKTLEEPPEHVVFILATTEVHKLPATIISRTQRHSLRLVSTDEVAAHLKTIAKNESIDIDEGALRLLAEHGGGSFRDSISLLDQVSNSSEAVTAEVIEQLLGLAPRTVLESLLQALQSGNGADVFQQLNQLLQTGLTPAHIASQLVSYLRNEILGGSYNTETIVLMEQLVGVQSAQYPQLKLETTLVSAALRHTPAPQVVRPAVAQKPPAPQPPQKKDSTPEQSEKTAETPTEPREEKEVSAAKKQPNNASKLTQDMLETSWPKILETTKQKNNPLYTVLRLAIATLDEEGLLLIFQFPFHQKKIDESRHKALIAEIITEVTGASTVVRSLVDKERAKSASQEDAPQTDPAHASLISQVQDIMGGGEVVHV
ncbi:MAG: DNA polymerase III subunit gamma/tau [Candidatus Saccharimonadales bacterium]